MARHYQRPQQYGLTLIEILTSITIIGVLSVCASYAWNDIIPRYQVRTATMTLHSLIRQARAGAITDGNRMICDGQNGCNKFEETQQVWMGFDRNNGGNLNASEIIEHYQLPGQTRLIWKRFKGNALVFHNKGNSHFQNGSFYLCNPVAARRITMNWIGRPRVETAKPEDCD